MVMLPYLLDLIENLQREDLSPEEEADALGELIRTRGWTLQQVADSVKRSVAYVSKRVRVFEDPLLREAIATQGLPVSTAEELLASDAESRGDLIQQALVERWDQVRARDALRGPEPAQAWLGEEAAGGAGATSRDGETVGERRRSRTVEPISAVRPKGLTRAVREFHRLLMGISSEHLTHGDRPRCVRCSATWCFWRAHRPRPVSQSFLRCRRCPSRPSARGQAHLRKVALNPRSRVESRSARNRGALFRNETARSPSIRTNGAGEMTCGCGIAEPKEVDRLPAKREPDRQVPSTRCTSTKVQGNEAGALTVPDTRISSRDTCP